MIAPAPRVWLYPVNAKQIEIVLLGSTLEIAPLFVEIKTWIEKWPGFEQVQVLTQGSEAIGITARLSNIANHADVMAEAMLMLRPLSKLDWCTCAAECRTGAMAPL